jgi:Ni/Co efflux regulator RcnB
MNKTCLAFALAAVCSVPALAQQADYCNRSGYVTGVTGDRETPYQSCDQIRDQQRKDAASAARQGRGTMPAPANGYYNSRGYDRRYDDPRYAGNRDSRESRDWERYRGEGNYYYGARGPEWRRGGHIPREYMGRQYWVEDWRAHRLAPPPRGYQWVQVGNDYVLVALATGIIAQLLLAQ